MRPRTLGGLLLQALLVSLCLGFVAAIGASKWYWGYWLARPSLDARILEARRYLGVVLLERPAEANVPWTFQDDEDASVRAELKSYRADDYTDGHVRVLHALDQLGALDLLPVKKVAELPLLPELLQNTGVLIQPQPGYEKSSAWMRGLALEAEGHDGRRLLFVGLHGGEVSNDHTPIYEFLFEAAPGTQRFELLSARRWFVDIAGYEGFEWYVMFPFTFPAALLLVLIGLGILLATGGSSEPRA